MVELAEYDKSVFLNCPFDGAYGALFEAIVFAVFDCGFSPRCALEADDGGQVRLEKILGIIADCRFGISDLSRTDLDAATSLPRFNMPLELGIFLGARRFGDGKHRAKRCLILDREKYRYRVFLSDISGQDIREHRDDPLEVIRVVRNWLRSESHRPDIPGGKVIGERYLAFRKDLPALCREVRLTEDDLIFADYADLIFEWLQRNSNATLAF
ncbi:MAG: hypothetical protein JF614_12830 [Acidobacteria bacterium]|nr:hypothetical protein [Acidobacteriota bacterium]